MTFYEILSASKCVFRDPPNHIIIEENAYKRVREKYREVLHFANAILNRQLKPDDTSL